ncbi:MAG: energy transducer TonB [Leptospiraceae bacterium]|nr:energy transducer TonB [Leptospiraceae bacterium]
MKILKNEPFSEEIESLSEDERRVLFSASIVLLVLSLLVAHLFTRNLLWRMIGTESIVDLEKRKKYEDKIYHVLLEQDFKDKSIIEDQMKALSDEDAAGRGGLTQEKGFHTLSPFYEFILGGAMSSQPADESKTQKENEKQEEVYEVGIYKSDPVQKAVAKLISSQPPPLSQGQITKIPFNYRFKQDFLFRWDGSRITSIPRKQLAGYHYFKAMLKKIESNFYPPGGGNFAYRDMAGLVIREGILPGQVKVSFLLNDAGEVIDVRVDESQGQKIVDQACVESIRGQNFGIVPPEVKENGMIFGINFIFPEILRYR